MKREMLTVPDLIRDYVPEMSDSKARRIAKLCQFVAAKLPGSFLTKRYVAKVAFALNKLPADGSEYCGRKLGSLLTSAEQILIRETGDYMIKHKFLGVRMTYSEDDKARNPYRSKRKRLESAIRGIQGVVGNIKVSELSPELRKDMQKHNRYASLLEDFCKNVPLLEPAAEKETET